MNNAAATDTNGIAAAMTTETASRGITSVTVAEHECTEQQHVLGQLPSAYAVRTRARRWWMMHCSGFGTSAVLR